MKIDEQVLLEFRIELEELKTEREKIIASSGYYKEESFEEIETKMQNLRERLVSLREKKEDIRD